MRDLKVVTTFVKRWRTNVVKMELGYVLALVVCFGLNFAGSTDQNVDVSEL